MSFPRDVPPWTASPPRNVPPDPRWGGPVWGGAPGYGYAASGSSRTNAADGPHVLWAFVVAVVIAAVVLGGIGLNDAIAAPSAGDVAIGGSVTITAAPGWVLSADTSSTPGAIELRTADAILVAQAVQNSFHGDLASLLGTVEGQLQTDAAQVSFGESHSTSIGGHAASYATFEATMSSSTGTGVIDGEIVCLDVAGTVVVVEVATPQGRFDYVAGDVSAMLESLRPSA